MNSKVISFVKNFSYTVISNLFSLITSTILIVIIPRFVSIEDYGYWQLYIFYSSFISYMSLGLTDGAYLRYGGREYKDLYKPIFVSQYWFLVVFSIVMNFSITVIYGLNSMDPNKSVVVFLACLTGVIIVPMSLLTFMLQATNRIKEYSITTIFQRVIYILLVILLLITGGDKFEYIILSDLLSKLISLCYICLICRELVFGKLESLKVSTQEIWVNISVGSKLLFANLASLLIIGIVRYCIENRWGIEIFGKVSLAISISNMLMLFINAIGIVLFPTLRRTSEHRLPDIYKQMKTFISVPLIGILIIYYPVSAIISLWLPHYSDSLIYMALLFPMCIYESKMAMLINTYLKTLRKEKVMLIINLITVVMSLILTYINVFILNNLSLTVLTITVLFMIRSIIAELYIGRILNIEVSKDIILEVFMTIIFLVVVWNFKSSLGWIIYLIAFILYLFMKKDEVTSLLVKIKPLIGLKDYSRT